MAISMDKCPTCGRLRLAEALVRKDVGDGKIIVIGCDHERCLPAFMRELLDPPRLRGIGIFPHVNKTVRTG